jgi:hypothetical protein
MGFEEGHEKPRVHARNRVARVLIFYPIFTTRLRQNDYELKVRVGFGH